MIGSETELRDRAVEGWEAFAGHTPHRPWIDEVKIACSRCGETVSRIKDVGNPWLDAGIVPFSTLHYRHDREYWEEWFPAEMISESFPGQFRNWFYSMIAQSTALVDRPPFLNVFSYALMRDEKGEEMHKSKGNAIWFDEAAEEIGVDAMRWLFSRANPDANLNFGYHNADDVRRRFILPLWNSYAFFATYAALDRFDPHAAENQVPLAERTVLDRWIISQLHQLIAEVRDALDDYAPDRAARAIERFTIDELSNWYIRRNRRRFWKSENDADKAAAYQTLYESLTTLARLLAPFTPFLAEAIYQNLVRSVDPNAPESVHLTDYPVSIADRIDDVLVARHGRRARGRRSGPRGSPGGGDQGSPTAAGAAGPRPRTGDARVGAAASRSDPRRVEREVACSRWRTLGNTSRTPSGPICERLVRASASRSMPSVKPSPRLMRAKSPPCVRTGSDIHLDTPEGQVTLEPSDILVDTVRLPGYAAAQGPRSTVVLDTTLTPALIEEGLARDFVRGIQDARKQAGYQIDDTIDIRFVADPEVARAIEAHRAYVMTETLATVARRSSHAWSIRRGRARIGRGSRRNGPG